MARVWMKTLLPAPSPWLWPLVCWDGRLPDWYPAAMALEVDGLAKGALRRLRLRDGSVVVERLEHLSQIGDAYTYSVLSSPHPITNYLAQLRVLPHDGKHVTLAWTANFQAAAGTTEADAEALIRRIYQAGLDSLHALFAHTADDGDRLLRTGLQHDPNAPLLGS